MKLSWNLKSWIGRTNAFFSICSNSFQRYLWRRRTTTVALKVMAFSMWRKLPKVPLAAEQMKLDIKTYTKIGNSTPKLNHAIYIPLLKHEYVNLVEFESCILLSSLDFQVLWFHCNSWWMSCNLKEPLLLILLKCFVLQVPGLCIHLNITGGES